MAVRPIAALAEHLITPSEAAGAQVLFMPLDRCGRTASGEEMLRQLASARAVPVRPGEAAGDARGLAEIGLGLNLVAVLRAEPGEAKATVLGLIDLWAAISEDGQELDLRGADLRGASLTKSSLRGVRLDGARLQRADLRSSDLSLASLDGADFTGATLRSVNLSQSRGKYVVFERADLTAVGLNEVELSHSTFVRADLDSAFVKQARFVDCHFDAATKEALIARGADV